MRLCFSSTDGGSSLSDMVSSYHHRRQPALDSCGKMKGFAQRIDQSQSALGLLSCVPAAAESRSS